MCSEDVRPTPEEAGAEDEAKCSEANCVDSALGDELERWSPPRGKDANSTVTQLEAELQAARQNELRHRAELENFRKRMRREMEDERRYAALPLISDLLSAVDNLNRAIAASEQNENNLALLEGVKMVASQIQGILQKHGCEAMEPIGKAFDPHFHEAMLQEPSEQFSPGTVTRVTQTGYKLHDRVVRPAQVFVAAQSAGMQSSAAEADAGGRGAGGTANAENGGTTAAMDAPEDSANE